MKVVDAIGAQLDWMVAKCEGYVLTSDGISNLLVRENETLLLGPGSSPLNYSPICYWMQGGEIIERETLCLEYDKDWVYDPATADPDDEPDNGDRWMAWPSKDQMRTVYGPTPLIAAMRCFVASRLGDEVEVPDQLV